MASIFCSAFRVIISTLFLSLLLGCEPSEKEGNVAPASLVTLNAEQIRINNQGVGKMGQYDYAAAHTLFSELVAALPQWDDGLVNLAISTLNRQHEGDEAVALELVREVIARSPDHLAAQFVAGILLFNGGQAEQAAVHFEAVHRGDPGDAYATYFLAQGKTQSGDYAQALTLYEQAIESDSYLRSAYYGAFLAAQRLGDRGRAESFLALYQRLANNPRAALAEIKYTRMGPKAEAKPVAQIVRSELAGRPQGAIFAKPQTLLASLHSPGRPVSITVADIDSDGREDIFLAGVEHPNGSHNTLLFGASQNYRPATISHPLAVVDNVRAAAWGDFDNDGLTDLYLGRQGENQLWRQRSAGVWENVTEQSQTAAGHFDTRDIQFVDADHDGDLDLLVSNLDGPAELLNNNLDGTFRPLAAQQGLSGHAGGSRQWVATDFDGDRDTDLVYLGKGGHNRLLLNDRLWQYHSVDVGEVFTNTPLLAAISDDLDADGSPELYTLSEEGQLQQWKLSSDGRLKATLLVTYRGAFGLLSADTQGNGRRDILVSTPAGISTVKMTADSAAVDLAVPGAKGAALLNNDGGRGPGLFVLTEDRLDHFPPGPGRFPFLSLWLSGKEAEAESMRSNASGIGTLLHARLGTQWVSANSYRNGSGGGHSRQPVVLGMGGRERVDFVELFWSDGVYQTELDLEAGEHRLAETQRQLSSCPVLFTWDGSEYRFISDILGVGGIGFAVAPGEYGTPRPWENYLLPDGALIATGGHYKLKITEPMEEVAYLDEVQLVAIDLPDGVGLGLDERMATGDPEVTGRPFFIESLVLPQSAGDLAGSDVTEELHSLDRIAAPTGPLDHRFLGLVADRQEITLSFSSPVDDAERTVYLLMGGWVEYGYSQTSFAAWQAGRSMRSPTLEVRGSDGQWQVLLKEFGYPAGMPRLAAVPLPKLPLGTRELRLHTNQEIYFDYLALAYARKNSAPLEQPLKLTRARLAKTGFAQRSDGPQRLPSYEYRHRASFWDARYMTGLYTRLGPVEELVQEHDDAVVTIGAGEELHLEFSAALSAPKAGYTRRFILKSRGWAKDMDLYTRDGETVGPMPSSGKDKARRDALHARYNVRFQDGA